MPKTPPTTEKQDEKKKRGRPLKFKTPKELQAAIDAYFESCWVEKKRGRGKKAWIDRQQVRPYTITGLALALNSSRQTILEYEGEVEGREKKDPAFADAIKKAKLRCENHLEENLFTPKIAAGVIFNLKNNYGWKDKQEIDHTTKGKALLPTVIKVVQPAPARKDAG